MVSQYPLDGPLGVGAHVAIRTIIGQLDRPYSPAPFVAGQAQVLRNAGINQARARQVVISFCQNMDTAMQFQAATAAAIAFVPQLPTWSDAAIVQLVQDFVAPGRNPNNFTSAQWAGIAGLLGTVPPAQRATAAAAFARVRGHPNTAWTLANAQLLVHAFVAQNGNPNALAAADWTAIAAALPVAHHGDVPVFARVRGRGNTAWLAADALALAQAFAGGNPNAFTAAEWTAVAALLPANQHADAAAFVRANNWAHADIVALATRYGTNAYGETPAAWMTMANRIYPRNNWAQYTANAMRYRSLGWPDVVVIGGANWNLEASGDGVIYRRIGVPNPHITIHQVNAGPVPWANNPDLHVVTGGPNSPWDYRGRQYDPFLRPNQAPPVPPPQVTAIINDCCTALGI